MKKLKVLSLFANVGVAEALLHEMGLDVCVANEVNKERAEFYKCIYKNTNMICGDLTDPQIMAEVIECSRENKVNFVIATPPCQGMSEAGLRLELDPRNQLISYAIEVIKELQPKFVLLENVPKQLTTKIRMGNEIVLIPEYIKRELSANYRFNEETLIKAKDCGVPQLRERNIFLLVRKDLPYIWEFPRKEREITLYEAIGELPSLDPLLREGLEFTIEKFPNYELKRAEGLKVSKWHYPPIHSWHQVEWMTHTPTGKSAIYNELFYPKKKDGTRIKAHHNNYRRLKWDMPCRTITQNNGVISSLACVHPGRPYSDSKDEKKYSDARVLTIYELLIVMSLPVDWPIPDWASESLIRRAIGEGIPSKVVARIINELIQQF